MERTAPTEVDVPANERFNRFGLSRQESRVLALAMDGRIDKQIAAEMGISLGTVRVYWKRIRQKTGGTRSETITSLARRDFSADFDLIRERAEELERELAVRESVERQTRMYEAAFLAMQRPCAVLEGPDGRILLANAAFVALLDDGEVVGRPITDWATTPQRIDEDRRTCSTLRGAATLTLFGEGAGPFVAWQTEP